MLADARESGRGPLPARSVTLTAWLLVKPVAEALAAATAAVEKLSLQLDRSDINDLGPALALLLGITGHAPPLLPNLRALTLDETCGGNVPVLRETLQHARQLQSLSLPGSRWWVPGPREPHTAATPLARLPGPRTRSSKSQLPRTTEQPHVAEAQEQGHAHASRHAAAAP
jgi:hypothetical protein